MCKEFRVVNLVSIFCDLPAQIPHSLRSKIEQKLSETTTSPEVLHKESAATTKQETPQIEEKQITSPVSTIQDVSTLITQTESVKVDNSDTKTYDSSEYTTTNTTSSKPSKKLAPAKMMFRNTKS